MECREEEHLESALTAQCGRTVRVSRCRNDAICVVLEPTGDRGRVELVATGSDHRWTVSDRGAVGGMYGLDLDCVIAKLSAFGTSLSRRGDELVADTDGRSLAEAVAEFVDSIEFVPVLVGLLANELAAWTDFTRNRPKLAGTPDPGWTILQATLPTG